MVTDLALTEEHPRQMNVVRFRILNPQAKLPTYVTPASACFDVSACLTPGTKITTYSSKNELREIILKDSRVIIHPSERYLIPTGWAVACPHGYSLRLYSRSGLSLKSGLMLVNGIGIIDEDYRHEVCVLFANTSWCAMNIEHGMRICQGEFVPQASEFSDYRIVEVTDEQWFTTQRTGGFGSTGVK
jgi:dUTP pyrophosphatase